VRGRGAVQENLLQTAPAVFASTVPKFSLLTISCGHYLVNHTDLYNGLIAMALRLWRGRDKHLNTSQLIYETKVFFTGHVVLLAMFHCVTLVRLLVLRIVV
jgi:hypothetical protein